MKGHAFSFRVERPSRTQCVVRLAGEIDLLSAPELQDCIAEQLGTRPRHLILDFAGVAFLGSSGLAVLVSAKDLAEERDVKISLTGTDHPPVSRAFKITGLDRLFSPAPPGSDRAT
jgi:anti-sigma B factor antagonist